MSEPMEAFIRANNGTGILKDHVLMEITIYPSVGAGRRIIVCMKEESFGYMGMKGGITFHALVTDKKLPRKVKGKAKPC